jgi:hypothetical protein
VSIRIRLAALGASALLAVAGTASAASAAVHDPVPVSPDVSFAGLVNGQSSLATIEVACIVPAAAGATGHPLPGQTLEVVPAPATSAAGGYTGSLGTGIDAYVDLPTSASAAGVVVFNSFYVQEPIPTGITVPCSGPGSVSFVPEPTSPTARTATVPVTFTSEP